MNDETFDIVVAGAGHNGLIAAAYLAKAGLRVVVVEARDAVGGDTATEELTLPGFLPDPVVHMPFPDGSSITQWLDLDRTCEEFARFSGRDADALRRLLADYDAVKGAFSAYRFTPIGWGPSLPQRPARRPARGHR